MSVTVEELVETLQALPATMRVTVEPVQPPHTYTLTAEIATVLLEAETTCYGESLAGLPNDLLVLIRKCFPEVAAKIQYLED